MRFSLFFFSGKWPDTPGDHYRLFRDSVQFADRHGFEARLDTRAALQQVRRPLPEPCLDRCGGGGPDRANRHQSRERCGADSGPDTDRGRVVGRR